MSPMLIKCPTCQREIEWAQSQFRPFCSERCKLIDLGAWLTEKHTIPGENIPAEPGQDDEPGTR